MKRIIPILYFVLMGIFVKAQDTQLKRYELKSGIVEYTTSISGKIMGTTTTGNGTEKLYFKNWGAIELLEEESIKTSQTKFFGKETTKTSNVHNLSKLDNGTSYSVDFKNKKIIKREDVAMSAVKSYRNGDAHQTGKEMLEAMGGEKIGEEKVLGYNCEIWTAMGTKIWIYKGIPLKTESDIVGMKTIKVATKAKFNIAVSSSYFQLPNYPITTINDMMEGGRASQPNDLNSETEENNEEPSKADLEHLKNMSFEEYKEMSKKDPESRNKTDEELREEYSLMKFMLKMSNK